MKQKILIVLFAFGLVAMTWAQAPEQGSGRMHGGKQGTPRVAAETVTVSGNLVVAHGFPALKSGDDTYFVRGINRLSGFIDGLKEGAQVTVEGLSFTSPRDNTLKFLKPAKMTLNGKSYDMDQPGFRNNSGPEKSRQHGWNQGHNNPRQKGFHSPNTPRRQHWL